MRLGLVLILVGGIGAVVGNLEGVDQCYRCISSDAYHNKPENISNLGLQCTNNPETTPPHEVKEESAMKVVCTTKFIQAPNNSSDVIVERSHTFMEDPESLDGIGKCHNITDQAQVLSECNCIQNLCNEQVWSQVWARTDLKEETLTAVLETSDNSTAIGSLPTEGQSYDNHTGHENHSLGNRAGKSNHLVNNTNTMKPSGQNVKANSASAILKLNHALYICLEILIAFIVVV